MGLNYKNKIVLIPCYRADIMHEIDLVEDIAIAYGYDKFKEEIPNVSTIASENVFEKFKRKIKDILIGFDYLECNSYNLISEDVINKMEFKSEKIKVLNPVNVEYNTLRNNILSSLMKILNENKHHEYPQKIFEIGNVFLKEENENLGLLSCHNNANFTEIKQILDYIFNSLDLTYELKETEHGSFINGRTGEIICKGKRLGYIGEINPKVINNFNLEMPVSGIEINLSEMFKLI
jgi:phenylalanyl-tRNA synthetase beta chain